MAKRKNTKGETNPSSSYCSFCDVEQLVVLRVWWVKQRQMRAKERQEMLQGTVEQRQGQRQTQTQKCQAKGRTMKRRTMRLTSMVYQKRTKKTRKQKQKRMRETQSQELLRTTAEKKRTSWMRWRQTTNR